jgi:hypothetical protein
MPAIACTLDGAHASIIVYGMTGAGKTYTMQGTASEPGMCLLHARVTLRLCCSVLSLSGDLMVLTKFADPQGLFQGWPRSF